MSRKRDEENIFINNKQKVKTGKDKTGKKYYINHSEKGEKSISLSILFQQSATWILRERAFFRVISDYSRKNSRENIAELTF